MLSVCVNGQLRRSGPVFGTQRQLHKATRWRTSRHRRSGDQARGEAENEGSTKGRASSETRSESVLSARFGDTPPTTPRTLRPPALRQNRPAVAQPTFRNADFFYAGALRKVPRDGLAAAGPGSSPYRLLGGGGGLYEPRNQLHPPPDPDQGIARSWTSSPHHSKPCFAGRCRWFHHIGQ